jgi:hypothetical protein
MQQAMNLKAALAGGAACLFLAVAPVLAQVSSINSAIIEPRVFNDMSNGTGTYINTYPSAVTLGETGVGKVTSGGLDRDVFYFSNNSGASAYQFQANDFFDMSFGVTLTGGDPAADLEAGVLFSNSSGSFGGDCQLIVQNTGGVVQFGGPSFHAFSPQDGGSDVPNYTEGTTYTLGLNYVIDPGTGNPSFQYSVNGVFAQSSPGDTFFDFSGGGHLDGASPLGGYLQIGNSTSGSNSGEAVFSNITITAVPEPAAISLLGLGALSMLRRRR